MHHLAPSLLAPSRPLRPSGTPRLRRSGTPRLRRSGTPRLRRSWLRRSAGTALALGSALAVLAPEAFALRPRPVVHEAAGRLTWTSPQSNPVVLSADGAFAFVASTTSNRVDVINTATRSVVDHVDVGMEPVSLAVRPGDAELWVANHVSDSVSVIDIDIASPTFLRVVETVQDLDSNGVTRFDEPVGIAFKEDGTQAYVALSSRNDVAIVDTATYQVTGRVHITAQEPRALAVRGDRLYVASFESNNRSELSICESLGEDADPNDCTLDVDDVVAFVGISPNLPGFTKNIDIDPDAPDRDLFVYDIGGGLSDGAAPLETVEDVGTLLYGLAVSHTGDVVYVTQADARNAENGNDAGATNPDDVNSDGVVNLADLENRMFLNQITEVNCGGGGCGAAVRHDLEEPAGAAVTLPLATPYGIAISGDDSTLVVTAAGSSRMFTWSAGSGLVLGHLDVGSIPRGVALRSDPGTGAPQTAWVLNTLGNTVSVVDVSNPAAPALLDTVPVGDDPTPDAVRRGRIAFNDANASTSGTFSCASCHPDGNTDQLLWRIGGECFITQANGNPLCRAGEDEPRTTMPVRGLRDTVPLHWDGVLGDPFGGPDGSDPDATKPPSQTADGDVCSVANQAACFRHLVEASLSGVMCDQASCATGPSGEPGLLTDQERADMAVFLESVSYPPPRSRRPDDAVTASARTGFEDFFFDRNNVDEPDTCADSNAGCHELPLGTATNASTLGAFDAPTMRGMTDRFLQFSVGISNASELLLGLNDGACTPLFINLFGACAQPNPIAWNPADGFEEDVTFGLAFGVFTPVYGVGMFDIFQMFEEASTGFSGALGRQVTLSMATTDPVNPPGPPPAPLAATESILADLEDADERGLVNLRGVGKLGGGSVTISYEPQTNAASPYKLGTQRMDRATLLAEAQSGALLATLTGHLRGATSEATPQPLIAPEGAQCGTGAGLTGDPAIPFTSDFVIEASHVTAADTVFLNGQPTTATITVLGPATACATTEITTQRIQISGLTRGSSTELLQILGANGLLSNEMPLP